MSALLMLCRFCAKEQPAQSLIDLKTDEIQRQAITQKLSLFSEVFVDFSNEYLPETVCTTCYSILNTSYEFFVAVKESQIVLYRLCNDVEVKEYQPSLGFVKEEFDVLGLDNYERDSDTEDPISWSTYKWCCTFCNTMLPSMQAVRDHSQEIHGTCCAFQCADCEIRTDGFEEFVEHVRWHWRQLKKYCKYCHIKMETAAHKENHHNTCSHCGQMFQNKSILYSHQKKNVSKPTRHRFHVEICNDISNLHTTDIINDKVCKIDSETYETDNTYKIDNTKHKIDEIDNKTNEVDNTTNKNINLAFKMGNTQIDNTTHTIDNVTHISETTQMINKKHRTVHKTGIIKKKPNTRHKSNHISKMDYTRVDDEEFKMDEREILSWSQYPSICRFCNIHLAYKEKLKEHCMDLHRHCFGMKCADCGDVSLDTFRQFVMHVEGHRPYLKNVCLHCDTNTLNSSHTHAGRHCCTVCGETFRNARDLRRHDSKLQSPVMKPVKRRGPVTDDHVTCDICGKRMGTPHSLRAHKLTHTDRKRNHTCDRCGKAFYTKATMEAHHKIHENNKETCKICNKTFLTLQRLRKHVKTHNLEMPFQCDDCKRLFSSKDSLRAHVSVHLNLKPFACPYCCKKFRYKHTMKTHENQHTGARPYSCDVCCINFACWSNCDKHMRRIHGVPLAKSVKTPHGKIDIDPETGKPSKVSMTSVVKEWGKALLEKPFRRKNQDFVKKDLMCNKDL